MNVSAYPKVVLNAEWRLLRLPYTVVEAITAMNDEPQTREQEARRAFVEDFMGRVKGIAGFVMGDDELIARGQIDRAKAALRIEAVTNEAIAELRERTADSEFGEARQRADEEHRRIAANEAQRKIRVAQEASLKKAEVSKRSSREREATKLKADAQRKAIDDAAQRTEREYVRHLRDAADLEGAAEDAKIEAEVLENARKTAKP